MTPDLSDVELARRADAWALLSQPIEATLRPIVADLEVRERGRESFPGRRDASWSLLYEEIRPLARGGMGRTILARERLSDRTVCIKELYEQVDVRMLEQEYVALSRMSHPNIVRVLHMAPHAAPPYLVAEYVDGIDIRSHARTLPLRDEVSIARLMRPVFDAITTLHSRDIIHRDLKPENVLVSRHGGQPIVIDLGLAVVDRYDHKRQVTAEGLKILGTPAYMAPEQLAGARLKPAADIYALGVMLFELVTGHLEVPSTLSALFVAKATATSGLEVPDSFWRPRWPVLAELIRRCTHPNPSKRPTAEEARTALDVRLAQSRPSRPWWPS